MKAITIRCTSCGADNEIIATDVPSYEEVACSRCRQSIGEWGELVAAHVPETVPRVAA